MESFHGRVDDLVNDMVDSGMEPQIIMWMINSAIVERHREKNLDERLNSELYVSRCAEKSDNPTGDSEPSDITLEELNRELDEYRSHSSTCKCYLSTNDCPICHEGMAESKSDCCSTWYHEKCLIKWLEVGNNCPTCRNTILQDNNEILDVDSDAENRMEDPVEYQEHEDWLRQEYPHDIIEEWNPPPREPVNDHTLRVIPCRHNEVLVKDYFLSVDTSSNFLVHREFDGTLEVSLARVNDLFRSLNENEKREAAILGLTVTDHIPDFLAPEEIE